MVQTEVLTRRGSGLIPELDCQYLLFLQRASSEKKSSKRLQIKYKKTMSQKKDTALAR
jgi:hypothetical protein